MEPLYQIKVTCGCCDSVFHTSRVRPSFKKPFKTDTDFCAYYKTVNPDYYVVRVCPTCGFASTDNFSERLTDRQKKAYREKIGNQWHGQDYCGERVAVEAMNTYKLALLSAQAIEEKDRVIASLLHHIAWLYRYEGELEQEKRFIKFALDAYVRMFETERDSFSNARMMYLIGELNRRLGEYTEAARWFGRVIQDKRIMDAAMIRSCREQWQHIREELTGKGLELPEEMLQSGT